MVFAAFHKAFPFCSCTVLSSSSIFQMKEPDKWKRGFGAFCCSQHPNCGGASAEGEGIGELVSEREAESLISRGLESEIAQMANWSYPLRSFHNPEAYGTVVISASYMN